MKRWALVILVIAVVAIALSLNSREGDSASAPIEYWATDLLSGQKVSLVDYRGSTVLLTSWATWCTACKKELPSLSKLWEEKQAEGLVVIAVNIDLPGESRGINTIIKKYALTMTIWHDPNNRYSATFKALGTPTSVLIDSHGQIVKEWIGSVDFQSKEVNDLIKLTLRSQNLNKIYQ